MSFYINFTEFRFLFTLLYTFLFIILFSFALFEEKVLSSVPAACVQIICMI